MSQKHRSILPGDYFFMWINTAARGVFYPVLCSSTINFLYKSSINKHLAM